MKAPSGWFIGTTRWTSQSPPLHAAAHLLEQLRPAQGLVGHDEDATHGFPSHRRPGSGRRPSYATESIRQPPSTSNTRLSRPKAIHDPTHSASSTSSSSLKAARSRCPQGVVDGQVIRGEQPSEEAGEPLALAEPVPLEVAGR